MIKIELPARGLGRCGWLPAPVWLVALGAALLMTGCGVPNRANIQLRKQKQELSDQVASLQQQLQASQAEIAGLRQSAPTMPTLPADRLRSMFTVHRIEIGRFSGAVDLDPNKEGDEAVKIYLTPLDEAGEPVKATGNVVIDVFDLARETDNRIGHYEIDAARLKDLWRALGPLHAFVLLCPLQSPLRQRELAIHVAFTDQLTGRVFTQIKQVRVNPPPAPSTRPAAPASQPIARPS